MGTLAPYIAIVTAIVAAYLTYRNQMRLKTFELLFERQQSVIRDLELSLGKLYSVQYDLKNDPQGMNISKYMKECFHDGLILHHKVKGANFGGAAAVMTDTLWSIVQEPSFSNKNMSETDFASWIGRKLNVLSSLYGISHRRLTQDLERMAFSPLSRAVRRYQKRVKTRKQKS